MKTIIVALLAAVLPSLGFAQSLPDIHKRVGNYLPRGSVSETSILAARGSLYTTSFQRQLSPPQLWVYNFFNPAVQLAAVSWPGTFGNAIEVNGTIHVIGAQNPYSSGNALIHAMLDQSFNPVGTSTVLTAAAGTTFLNSGIGPGPNGSYVLSYDTITLAGGAYVTKFLQTSDFVTWTPIGGSFAPAGGRSGLALRPWWDAAANAYYMIMIINGSGVIYMQSATSPDLVTFTMGPPLLWPDYQAVTGAYSESDATLADFNGYVYMLFFDGNQATFSDTRSAIYLGTRSQLDAELFPPPPPPPPPGTYTTWAPSVPLSINDSSGAGSSYRQVCSSISVGGSHIRVTFKASSAGGWGGTAHASIAKANAATPPNSDSTPVELLFSGASGFSALAPGAEVVSDWLPFSTVSGDRLMVVMDVATGSEQYSTGNSNGTGWYKISGGTYNQATVSGVTGPYSGDVFGVALIEVQAP
jgi:hypothetical protein